MRQWISALTAAFLTFFLINPTQANANFCNTCCWSLCDTCSFEIGADFLFWKPCIDDLDVVALVETDNGSTHVEYIGVCPEWEPGVRVYITLPTCFCCWDLSASYTYIRSHESLEQEFDDSKKENCIASPLLLTGDPVDAVLFAAAEQKWALTYHEWDVLFSSDILCSPSHHLSPFFGAAGIVLDQELTGEFDEDTTFEWNSEYWGVGLRAGAFYVFDLRCGISIFASGHATLLAGEVCSENDQVLLDDEEEAITVEIDNDDCCHCVPGYHLAAGISYEGCWCGWQVGARLGYEFLTWHNIPNHRVFAGDNLTTQSGHGTSPSTRTLSFHGLFAGWSIMF